MCSLRHEVLSKPRGHIVWSDYVSGPLRTGNWHHLPCRFPELSNDPHLRALVKWSLERVRRDLLVASCGDRTAQTLASAADRLIELLRDVYPVMPRRNELETRLGTSRLEDAAIRRGIEAIGWVVDERGLGGGRELDGLAWHLSLAELWEKYVETIVRREAALVGADVKCARRGETVFPIQWSDSSVRGLSHLVPDFVVRRRDEVRIVDAKYKSHFAELDESGWLRMAEEARDAHRADCHQVLAYASLFDAKLTTVVLIYPLRRSTYEALTARNRATVRADLQYGGRHLRAELRGAPFGEGARS
jgi:5-methylcytosine-specific restriction endonuclease McrBC regulatory subunit McrC